MLLREVLSRHFREKPLLVFAVAGGLSYFLLAPYLPWSKETIRLDSRTVAWVIERRALAVGRELTDEGKRQAMEDYVDEEILVREARRRGWHLQNGRIRQRLAVAMRSLLSENVPEPSAAELSAYYQANAERYRVPPSVSFSQVFFASGPPSSGLLQELESGADFRAMGDEIWLGTTVVRETRHQLQGALGADFTERVLELEPGSWFGPLESSRGFHYVRVLEHHPSVLPELASIERFVRADWSTESREAAHERTMSQIRKRYTVVER